MDKDVTSKLAGRRLLVVEDDYIIAVDVAGTLETLGADVLGPAATVKDALDLIESGRVDGASLDINLGEESVYPVADALRARGVPFVFTSGYDPKVIPLPYADVPRCSKPLNSRALARALASCFDS